MAPRSNRASEAALALIAAFALTSPARADDPVSSPAKQAAQALVTDGIALLVDKHYDGALEKFLAAYDEFPSPKILLNIASTLRDMGKLADAANTYQRYLEDPQSGAERVAEVKQIVNDLDTKLALLVVEVTPPGTEVSIDGGPWVTIGVTLSTRVTPGTHLVRARKAGLEETEVSINGFEGARKDLSLALKVAMGALDEPSAPVAAPPPSPATVEPVPEHTTGWLITGPHASGRGHARRGHSGTGVSPGSVNVATVGPSLAHYDDRDDDATSLLAPRTGLGKFATVVQARIDGKLRGAAASIGLAYDLVPSLQVEAALLLANDVGGFAGARMHFLTGRLRPLVSVGAPVFWSDGAARIGLRVGGGAEWIVQRHLSALVEIGVEHFFNPQDRYEATVVVPILGVHGRL
ncbi:MAG: hypothetical protein K8W52_32780 [Deltaproteobacteria bacterium]|nr:hypothetical protein [Deltaproteobacteria bacterium]